MAEKESLQGGWFVVKLWDETILVVVHVTTWSLSMANPGLQLFWPSDFRGKNDVSDHIEEKLRRASGRVLQQMVDDKNLKRIGFPTGS